MIILLLLIVILIGAGGLFIVNQKSKQSTFFSITSITEKLLLLIKRFPISFLSVVVLVVISFLSIEYGKEHEISYKFWIFSSVSIFIAVTVTLFAEGFFNYLKTSLISLFFIVIWGVYTFFLPEKRADMEVGKGIELAVMSAAIFLSMFFIHFLGKNKDRSFWNFAQNIVFQIALACFFGVIFFGGLSLAVLAIDSLFNIPIDKKIYGYLAVICFLWLSPIYFLANIPDKTEKYNGHIFYAKAQKILSLYVLMPILVVYTIILYIYVAKIFITWELPNGWVSWLVSALALGGLLVITLLYPIREQENHKIANLISRWTIVLVFPLLILMTIGVFRRIDDYGITINRGYILLLNIWFYGIYIYLFFTKSRHIKWILISFVAFAVVTSVSFWGVANITKNSLTREVSAILTKKVSFEEAKNKFVKMSTSEKERMRSVFMYLHQHFGRKAVQPFFTDIVPDYRWDFLSEINLRDISSSEGNYQHIYYTFSGEWQVQKIDQYNTFRQIVYGNLTNNKKIDEVSYSQSKDTMKILVDNNTFLIPIQEVATKYFESEENLRNHQALIVKEDDYKIIISRLNGLYFTINDSLDVRGLEVYLFYNRKKNND